MDIFVIDHDEWSLLQMQRKKLIEIQGTGKIYFASPEDIILQKIHCYKLLAAEKHLKDVAGIINVSGDSLDYVYISYWAKRMELMHIWEEIITNMKNPER